jgi:type I restriction enzyme, R subunit
LANPESTARRNIDRLLSEAGWAVQDYRAVNLTAARGVAVREFPLKTGHGRADYLLYVDGKAAGAVEAKKEGQTLTGVEPQAVQYSQGLPDTLPAHVRPLPFLYQSTGVETRFTNGLDPESRSREVFTFHRPETLAQWLAAEALWLPLVDGKPHSLSHHPATLRARLRALPAVAEAGLWPAQLKAVQNLERSFSENRPRALIQMATGSGKTYTAVSSVYRLIKHGQAKRVLFLVDRANLGKQTLAEFQDYATPDDGRKFSELYNVQLLASSRLDDVSRVCIGTIQRLYSMLKGEDLPQELDEQSVSGLERLYKDPVAVAYNPEIPIEYFDVIFVDECHRSIYTLWRQVLEYFDSFVVGLTATPSKQTLGFFNKNLVMEYGHEQAVADRVNVDFDVYRIHTEITEKGSRVEANLFVDRRDRDTRRRRWERLDEDLEYAASQLDRDVVTPDQIRTIIRTFKEQLFTSIFPGRRDVPKTLIFAKDDSHADDIVQIVREEFGKGNDFAQKITYKTTGAKPEDLIASFRNSYNPRIAVTVDMIATGTDIKPLEVVMFMRAVKSRVLFEQMKGRGVRVIGEDDFRSVTPDGVKDRFVIVDCVGVCERDDFVDTHSLNREPTVSLEKLLQAVALGTTDVDVVSTVAGRLARLELRLSKEERARISQATGGRSLQAITMGLVQSVDPDQQLDAARRRYNLPSSTQPTDEQLTTATTQLLAAALAPLASNPALRELLVEIKRSKEQIIDTVSQDTLIQAAYSDAAKERAKALVQSFQTFIRENRDEIAALQVLFSRPARRLKYDEVRTLADAIESPPRRWTTEALWRAYETLDASKVRGAPSRVLTNIVRLVRYAIQRDDVLVPHPDVAAERYAHWIAEQERDGRQFTPEQRIWLEAIRDHVAANLEMTPEDFGYAPFVQRGGLGGAKRAFGDQLWPTVNELTEVLAA